jgi:hypothetical protein
VAPGRPVLGYAERERPHGPRGGRGDLVGVVREDPGDGPARPGEVRVVQGGRQQAQRRAPRSDASAREAAFRTSSVFTERSRRSAARRSAGGLESAAATGARASTSRKTALEEAMASRILERNLRLRLGGEERGEAVGDVGLEGVQGEELVVLGGVEGGHGGGAAAEAKHAEEAGGRRGIGGGHERSASVVAAIAEGVTVSYIQYIYTSTHAFSLPLTREPHHADGLVAGGGSFVVACHCGTC